MKRTWIVLLHLAFAIAFSTRPSAGQAVASGSTAESEVAGRIDSVLRASAEAHRLSGVILVARGGEVQFRRAYGKASWELDVPNRTDHRFGIASISKPMTEAVVAQLVREGRIDLDDPVEEYLAGFPRGPRGGVPTIRDLVAHRSGVPHRVTNAVAETQPLRASDIVQRVEEVGLLFEPGTRELYSSAGFTSLARVIEIVEGRPFEEVLADRVFAMADMSSAVSETGQQLMPARALPHRLGSDGANLVVKSVPYKDLRFLTGAGSVYATADDLMAFVLAIRNGVFGDELRERLSGGSPDEWRGWTGRTNGYEASVDVLPGENTTFVFLSNLQSAANWQAREAIQAILSSGDPDPISSPPHVAPPFENAESLVGTFGAAEIRLYDGALFRGDNEFYPIEGGRYYIPASGTVMRFRRTPDGQVDALVGISGSGQESVLPRSE